MKIPGGDKRADRIRRLTFVEDLKRRCLVSRDERRSDYAGLRLMYLYGTDGGVENSDIDTDLGPPPGNKIYPHLQQLKSFLYSQETTRFSVEPGVGAAVQYMDKVPRLGQYVNEQWHAGNSDIYFGVAVEWALVYGSFLLKPLWRRNGIYPYLVHPHNFGVLREDTIAGLSRQEAFVECYVLTRSQLENSLEDHPNKAKILKAVSVSHGPQTEAQPMLSRIILSATDPLSGGSGAGQVDWMANLGSQYIPRVEEEMVEMYELYAFDDELKDYRVFTIADPGVVIFDRPLERLGVAHMEPYIQICPNPTPDYWWGIAEVERLTPLQQLRNQRMAQIQHLLDMQAHPPSAITDFPGEQQEIQYALDTPNGILNNPDSSGKQPKADRVRIELPENLWHEITEIDKMFEEMSGLTPITQGRGETGVRSQTHASQLARIGSSRPKERALIIEDQLEIAASLYLKILQKYDDTILRDENGEKFLPDQFVDGCVVKVDAHSSSPIFVEDMQQLAFALKKAGVITGERLLDLVNVPMRDLLKHELKTKIEPAQQKQHDEEMKLRLIEGHKKGPKTS